MKKPSKELGLNVFISLIFSATILLLNFLLIKYWFAGEFNQNMASIEISYVQMAKFWVEGGGLWQPLWYLGYPWHVFYTPFLPFLEVILHGIRGYSFAHVYRLITGAGYVLAPVSVYFFVWQISKSKSGAFVAALFYSFAASITSFFFEGVSLDTLSGVAEPRRLAILVRWGEGPHTLALVFVPIFGVFLSRFIEKRRFYDLILTSGFLGLVALTNAVALWAAILLFIAFFLAELTKKSTEVIPLVKNLFLVCVLAFGLSAFWYNLPFISTFFREGGGAFNNWKALFPWGFLVFLAIAFGVFLIVKLLAKGTSGGAFSAFWFLMLFAIVFTYYASGESRLEFAPQALRLNTEMDLALSVIVGVLVSELFLVSWNKVKRFGVVIAVIIFALPSLVLLSFAINLIRVVPNYTKPLSASETGDITNTAEYRVAKELTRQTEGTDRRVLAPGNYGFWLNFFEPVPQLRGALSQSSTHFWPDHIYYQLANGGDANISLAWLKIANIGKFVYTTSGSQEMYKDFKVPKEKFEKVLKIDKELNGDIFFDVPLKNDLLAKVVDYSGLKSITKPANAIDEVPIFAYVNWIEQKADRKLKVEKISRSRLRVSGEIKEGEAVLVQETYDPGWKVAGGGWKRVRDPFDYLVLVPQKPGQFSFELVYHKPFSVYFGYLVTLLTLLVLARKWVIKVRKI